MLMDAMAICEAQQNIQRVLAGMAIDRVDIILDNVRRQVWLCAFEHAAINMPALADHPEHMRIVALLAGMRIEDANIAVDAARRQLWSIAFDTPLGDRAGAFINETDVVMLHNPGAAGANDNGQTRH